MVAQDTVRAIVQLLKQDSQLSHHWVYVVAFTRGFVAGQGLQIDAEIVAAAVLETLGLPTEPA